MHDFLRQASSDPELQNFSYWIDALCIDQEQIGKNGHQEKNHQVNMMGDIYAGAAKVIAWLGEPDASMEKYLIAANEFFESPAKCWDSHPLEPRQDPGDVHEALSYLGEFDYWNRVWVVQEVVKAKRVSIRCGRHKFPWKTYWTYELSLGGEVARHKLSQKVLAWDKYRNSVLLTLAKVVDVFGHQHCTDPRDRIYALLGIMVNPPVVADYSISKEALYAVLLQAFFDEYSSGESPKNPRSLLCHDMRSFSLALQDALEVNETAAQALRVQFLDHSNHMAERHQSSILSDCALVGQSTSPKPVPRYQDSPWKDAFNEEPARIL